jgi:CRP-like cAMP-binding protein
MLLTIEKVVILKSISIFSDTPEDHLAEVASILEPIEVPAGKMIIEKGDIGSSLYVIIDGWVRVHEGERTITELGERDIFGELAALDPEPRMASVTALQETRLFRLDRQSLLELMAEHTEIASGIIRMLCRRLRARADS